MANCLTLSRYAAHLGIDECGIWGVYYSGQGTAACGEIWTQLQRVSLLQYLEQARHMIELIIDYPLCLTWIAEDNKPYTRFAHTRWKHVLKAGVHAVTNISSGEATDLSVDPVVIGPVATTVTDPHELVIYHPGTTEEIEPSKIVIAGGTATFYIPRCRLVKTSLAVNPPGGWDLTDDNNFEATVDIVREYTDDSIQAIMVWPFGKNCCNGCTEETDSGCMAPINFQSGFMKIIPARFAGSAWTNIAWFCSCPPPYMRLNYLAGSYDLNILAMDAIIRLAHSMMPEGPCGCDIAMTYWKRDRNVPNFVAPERMLVPWGFSDGAWYAWSWTQLLVQHRASVL